MKEVKPVGKKPVRIGQLIKIVVFLLITAAVFHFFTLVYDSAPDQQVEAYRTLPENSVDLAIVGSSAVYRYFNTMQAWEQYGITAYDYAVAGANGENNIFSIKDVLKTQKPKALLVEVRGYFGSRDVAEFNGDMYRYIKNYRNPLDRWKILRHYAKLNGMKFSSSQLPYYLTLMMMHDDHKAILQAKNWKRALKGSKGQDLMEGKWFMGYTPKARVVQMPAPVYDPDIRHDLNPTGEEALRELLDYCSETGQKVILVSSPYIYSPDDNADMNAVQDIADEYGVTFLNGNKDASSIGIDYNVDFYNTYHTNLLGSVKYTDYILDRVREILDLPDHRGEKGLQLWDERDAAYNERKKVVLLKLYTALAQMYPDSQYVQMAASLQAEADAAAAEQAEDDDAAQEQDASWQMEAVSEEETAQTNAADFAGG